jgi:hypothetical protein
MENLLKTFSDQQPIQTQTTFSSVIDFSKSGNRLSIETLHPENYLSIHQFNQPKKGFDSNSRLPFPSPRLSSPNIFPNLVSFENDIQLRPLNRWFNHNVINYLQQQAQWEADVFPERILVAFGLVGVGRLTHTVMQCKKAKINLLFVSNTYREEGMYAHIYKTALNLQPCVVYFDHADEMIDRYIHDLNATHEMHLNYFKHNIWTIISTSILPTGFSAPMKYFMNPIVSSCVYVPVIGAFEHRCSFVRNLLQTISNDVNFPPEDPMSEKEWSILIDRIASAGDYCTQREFYYFIMMAFRSHHQRLALRLAGSVVTRRPQPDTSIFIESLDRYPFKVRSTSSYDRCLVAHRDPAKDYDVMNDDWIQYIQTIPPKIAIESMIPTPSVFEERQNDRTAALIDMAMSISPSSPSRSTPYIVPSSPTPVQLPTKLLQTTDNVAEEEEVFLPPKSPPRSKKPSFPRNLCKTTSTTSKKKNPITKKRERPLPTPSLPPPMAKKKSYW